MNGGAAELLYNFINSVLAAQWYAPVKVRSDLRAGMRIAPCPHASTPCAILGS
jgi:hypothetical protein